MQAVSLVLIPPQKIYNACININNRNPDRVTLDKKKFQPHLTLSMGVLDTSVQENVCTGITEIAKEFLPLTITSTRIQDNWLHTEMDTTGLKFQKLCHAFLSTQYTNDRIEPNMFYNPEQATIDDSVFRWFAKPDLFNETVYRPHITIWTQENNFIEMLPSTDMWYAVRLCHLGNFNTCRNVLWEYKTTI